MSDVLLHWHKTSVEDIEKYSSIVIAAIEKDRGTVWLPQEPENLIFHTIPTSDGFRGPVVIVWGVEGDERWHCQYDNEPEWLTSRELDEKEFIIPNWYVE